MIITGSSGFIGSCLMERIKAKSIRHQDIVYRQSYDCDKFFFLSTYGNMAHHRDYKEMLQANIADLVTILSSYNGWFCYMSSSSVTLTVQTPYSRFKKAGEEITLGIPYIEPCVVRPYSVIGVGEQKEHLIPTLIRSCMEGEEMSFDPDPVHDFVDVEDVVHGLIALSNYKEIGIHEFGKGVPCSNHSILTTVQYITGKKANIKHVQRIRGYDNPDWYCRNPSKYFTPKKTIEQSIKEMVEAYQHA